MNSLIPFHKSNSCLICKQRKLTKFLSLGRTTLANSYLNKSQLKEKELKVPLDLYYCRNCHLVQLLHIVNRKMLFQNYAYFSSTSPQLIEHFSRYAEDVIARFPKQAKKSIIEIGSNDGILLKEFKKRGMRVLGVDPARNVATAANRAGVETIPKFFGTRLTRHILKDYGKADIIIANNVLAHTDKLDNIIKAVKMLLSADGVFILQSKYIGDLLEKNEFDTVYHEHISYFSFLSKVYLLKKFGLKAFDVKHVETEGGSLRIFAGHTPFLFEKNKSIDKLLSSEHHKKFDEASTYLNFRKKPELVKRRLINILNKFKKQGLKIAGYGASAKGNTMLQYCGISSDVLDYIVDNAPSKQGLYTPGTHIPIVAPDHLKTKVPDVVLLLAWNFAPSIMEREKWFKKHGGRFVIPVPMPRII